MQNDDMATGRGDRTKHEKLIYVTGESEQSFAAAADAAWQEARRLAGDNDIPRAEVVKMEMVSGSRLYSVTLAFPEF